MLEESFITDIIHIIQETQLDGCYIALLLQKKITSIIIQLMYYIIISLLIIITFLTHICFIYTLIRHTVPLKMCQTHCNFFFC